MEQAERLDLIRSMPNIAKEAILEADGTQLVDVLGDINATATKLGAVKRSAAAEVVDGEQGVRWRYSQSMAGKRSYNTNGLLSTISSQLGHRTLQETLMFLMSEDVIRVTWQWSPLKKLVREHNLVLRMARREVEDGDPDFDYGEYWVRGSAKYEAVEDG